MAESETQRSLLVSPRCTFLRAVQELCPEVLDALRTNVFPSFTEIFNFARAIPGEPLVDGLATFYGVLEDKGFVDLFATIHWEEPRELTQPDRSGLPRYAREFAQAQEPKRKAVRDALESWASRFNLESEWVFDEALATMVKWLQQGEKTIDLRWALYSLEPGYSFAELAAVPVLRIEEQWAFEPLSIVRGSVATKLKAFESQVRTYANRIDFPLSKRAPNLRQYQWLALAHCKQYSTTQILNWHRQHSPARREMWSSDTIKRALDTIKHALKTAAKELGLKRWSRKHGRPPIKKR